MSHLKCTLDVFNMKDFSRMQLLDDEKAAVHSSLHFLLELAKPDSITGFAGIKKCDGDPLFAGGFVQLQEGIWHLFVIPDKSICKRARLFHREIRNFINWLQRHKECARLQTHSLAMPRIEKWMLSLGFVCEGETNSYNDAGVPYMLWSKSLNGSR